jgi:group I intron endonuclease
MITSTLKLRLNKRQESTLDGIVYLVINEINGKSYIGQTVRGLQQRWRDHLSTALRRTSHFAAAIRKYGESAFSIGVVGRATTKEKLDEIERNQIAALESNNPYFGYNLTLGGSGSAGYKKSPEAIEKTAAWHRGRKRSMEQRMRLSNSQKGIPKKFTDDTLKALSNRLTDYNKDRVLTEETRQKMSIAHKGIKMSKETRRKISLANKGKKKPKDFMAALNAKKKGVPLSQEHRAKLKEAWRLRKRNVLNAGAGAAHEKGLRHVA